MPSGRPRSTEGRRRLVVALGGNAILRRGERGTIAEQIAHAEEAMRDVAELLRNGTEVVLTHGNGPVVGNIVERNEAARDHVPPMPLWIDDADSEGGIGAMLQMALHNRLRALRVPRTVVTVVTQVVVAEHDPAFDDPTKPIGPWYEDEETASRLAAEHGWRFSREEGYGWRRVVASPRPLQIVETSAVRALLEAGCVAIAAGGGGVPVVLGDGDSLRGIDCVVDKDLAGALLAYELDADMLVILMEADRVRLGWGTDEERPLDRVAAADLAEVLDSGGFAEGTMAPKVEACVQFVQATGREALVCRAEDLTEALAGSAGTRIVP